VTAVLSAKTPVFVLTWLVKAISVLAKTLTGRERTAKSPSFVMEPTTLVKIKEVVPEVRTDQPFVSVLRASAEPRAMSIWARFTNPITLFLPPTAGTEAPARTEERATHNSTVVTNALALLLTTVILASCPRLATPTLVCLVVCVTLSMELKFVSVVLIVSVCTANGLLTNSLFGIVVSSLAKMEPIVLFPKIVLVPNLTPVDVLTGGLDNFVILPLSVTPILAKTMESAFLKTVCKVAFVTTIISVTNAKRTSFPLVCKIWRAELVIWIKSYLPHPPSSYR